MPATPRPLRRLRRLLAMLAVATALLIAAACRLDAIGRGVAAVSALVCLGLWLALLEAEGRVSERLESRMRARASSRRASTHAMRARPMRSSRRRAA